MRSAVAACVVLLAALASTARAAEAEAPPCPATDAALPAEFAGWPTKAPLTAATAPAGLSKATLDAGRAVTAALHPTREVTYAAQPEKPGGSVSFGGLFAFDVAQAGTYRVALGSGAWIDVLKGETAVTSTAHGHGPACSSVRKMVDFPLQPGRYVLQVSANGRPDLALMILRAP